jgi:hypothetical protein
LFISRNKEKRQDKTCPRDLSGPGKKLKAPVTCAQKNGFQGNDHTQDGAAG